MIVSSATPFADISFTSAIVIGRGSSTGFGGVETQPPTNNVAISKTKGTNFTA